MYVLELSNAKRVKCTAPKPENAEYKKDAPNGTTIFQFNCCCHFAVTVQAHCAVRSVTKLSRMLRVINGIGCFSKTWIIDQNHNLFKVKDITHSILTPTPSFPL